MKDSMHTALRTLADEAQSVDLYDRTLAESRRLKRRRGAVGSVIAAVAVVAVVLASIQILPAFNRGQQPSTPGPSVTHGPTPTSAAPSPGPKTFGLSVLGDNKIWSPDGPSVALHLPTGVHAQRASKIRDGGWLLEAAPSTQPDGGGLDIYYQSDPGAVAKYVSYDWGGYKVSGDGKVLVVSGKQNRTTAFSLPSLKVLGHTTWTAGMGPVVFGVDDTSAWLVAAEGSEGARASALWNFSSGAITTPLAADGVWPLDHAIYGLKFLRRIDTLSGTGKTAKILKSCLDIVEPDKPDTTEGTCNAAAGRVIRGSLSPNGTYAVLESGVEVEVVVSTADLHNGVWKPIVAYEVVFWLDDQRYIAPEGTLLNGFRVCDATSTCQDLVLPDMAIPKYVDPLVQVLNP